MDDVVAFGLRHSEGVAGSTGDRGFRGESEERGGKEVIV